MTKAFFTNQCHNKFKTVHSTIKLFKTFLKRSINYLANFRLQFGIFLLQEDSY
jgi:hypothetical protein